MRKTAGPLDVGETLRYSLCLDFLLVSQTILCKTTNADMLQGYKTDHSTITLNFSLHSNERWALESKHIRLSS